MEDHEVMPILREYVIKELLGGDAKGLDETTPLMEWGVIDSTRMTTLLTFIEERFSVYVPDSELIPKNFASLDALSKLVIKSMKKA